MNIFIRNTRTVAKILFAAVFLCTFTVFTSCSKQKKAAANRIVIWTSCSEFAQYIELYNKTHTEDNAILVYKENPALSLPPAKDEQAPDIVIGSWLRTDKTQNYFKNLDYMFDHQDLSSGMFYPQLLESGRTHHSLYLLPVSFNLPAVIYSSDNAKYISDSYTLSPEQIRSIGAEYNNKNKKGAYTRIGFAPLGNNDFLYLVTKLKGVDFRSEKNQMVWEETELQNTTAFLRDWIITENTSAQTEEDFTFKYLFMPYYRQVNSGRTLFAYTTSNEFLKMMKDQTVNIDYRWIYSDTSIPIEDTFTMLGIYKNCNNQVGAANFISWFFQPENQKAILERKEALNLETELFGIADGFSSVREVTEHILPIFYTQLLSNLPPAQMLTVPQELPAQWKSYKEMVVEEYLQQALRAETNTAPITIHELENEWRKKVYN